LTGIWEKSLFHDAIRSLSTRLVRLEPGAAVPSHRHKQTEETFVLEGTGKLGDRTLRAGDYHRAPSVSTHPSYSSNDGCVFLLFSGTEFEPSHQVAGQTLSASLVTIDTDSSVWSSFNHVSANVLFSAAVSGFSTALLRLNFGAEVNLSPRLN